jgi:uncharacterized protein YndB with AHSA1/START domain
MSTITVQRSVASSVDEVWSALADFGGIHRFSAAIDTSPINPGTPTTGVGAERTCNMYDGNHIQERVTESVEKSRLDIEIFDTSMPLKSAHVRFDLKPTSDGGCEVTMTMDYVVKFGIIGQVMDAVMMRSMMTKSLNRLLAGLDEYLRTGKPIEKGWTPAAAA